MPVIDRQYFDAIYFREPGASCSRSRPTLFGIALGYEDLIDHDQLRHDPVLATLAGKLGAKRRDCAPLAGKSSLNRLERAPLRPSGYRKIGHDPAASRRAVRNHWGLSLVQNSHGTFKDRRVAGRPAPGSEWYRRAMRAHMNCVENLPVYGAIVVCATAAGARSKLLDILALIFIAARICQTVVHIVFASTDLAPSVRFAFFFVQGALHDRNGDFSGGVGAG
jgi:uncharacterized MAPEG superfamily protein